MLETDNESQLQLWIHSYLNTSAEMTVDNKPPLDWQTSFKPAVDAENPDAARRESCKPQLWAADRGERWWWSAEEESGCRERERESPRTEMHKKKSSGFLFKPKFTSARGHRGYFAFFGKVSHSNVLPLGSSSHLVADNFVEFIGYRALSEQEAWNPRSSEHLAFSSPVSNLHFVPFSFRCFPGGLVGLALVGCGSCTLLHFRFFFFFPQQSVSHRLFCCVQEIPASQAAFNRTRTHIYSRLHFCIPHKKDLVEVRQM